MTVLFSDRECQTLKQRISYTYFHFPSNSNSGGRKKWRHFIIRFWSEWL